MKEIAGLLVLIGLITTSEASVISKSSKEECILEDDVKTLANATCATKLVVGFTVTANEGKSQVIQANVSRIVDATKKKLKTLELKTPLRIRIIKSPVIINFPLYQVGYVSNWPREEIKTYSNGERFACKDLWYTKEHEVNCGFAKDSEGEKIFDSQGFCCQCAPGYRGESQHCGGFIPEYTAAQMEKFHKNNKFFRVGHCLVHDGLKYFVMAFQPPMLQFAINVTLEKRSYLTTNGTGVWETVSVLEIGPHKRIATSDSHTVKVEYISDFHPSTFIKSDKLVHRFILIPDHSTLPSDPPFPDLTPEEWKVFKISVNNMSEWMAINKEYFDMVGFTCNKIGVSYTAFRRQPHGCQDKYGSCLYDQPYLLWKDEKLRQKEKRQGRFMLHNFGKVYSMPHTSGRTDFQVNFIADRPTTSLIVITMAADDLITITRVAPGRIVSAYIDAFEALSTTGSLLVVIQNMGSYTSTYKIFVQHCSAGIDLIAAKTATLDPHQSKNISFIIHSYHSVGRINYCEVNLYDINSKLMDNLTVTIETFDTCFCYGFCGCACGDNKTICPDAPVRPNSSLELYTTPWYDKARQAFENMGKFLKDHGLKIVIGVWVVMGLLILGCLKVAHIIITGDVKYPMATEPMMMAAQKAKEFFDKVFKEWCPMICDNCWTTCGRCCRVSCRHCFWIISCGVVKRKEKMLYKRRIERMWRPPPYCDGMCEGAKYRRMVHRKLMRVMKRTGARKDAPWFSKSYNCSCKVKDTMPCIMICRGLFFFFYCPFLPVYWILEFCCTLARRKWRRHKRIAEYRKAKAEKEHAKERQYLHMDKYSRGVLEKEIIDLDKELKEITRLEKEYEADMNPEVKEEMQLDANSDREDRNMSSEASLSDTSDPDQACDIDELLHQSFPVYFNYAIPKSSHSLHNAGHNYSIKGRLLRKTKKKKGTVKYVFDLHEYTHQVKQDVGGKTKELKPPLILDPEEFAHKFKDPVRTLKLVTLAPLFPCLNDDPKAMSTKAPPNPDKKKQD